MSIKKINNKLKSPYLIISLSHIFTHIFLNLTLINNVYSFVSFYRKHQPKITFPIFMQIFILALLGLVFKCTNKFYLIAWLIYRIRICMYWYENLCWINETGQWLIKIYFMLGWNSHPQLSHVQWATCFQLWLLW